MALSRPITVSVLARHGVDADGLATALSVLGLEGGIAFIENHPGAAALVVTDRVAESSRWPGTRRAVK